MKISNREKNPRPLSAQEEKIFFLDLMWKRTQEEMIPLFINISIYCSLITRDLSPIIVI